MQLTCPSCTHSFDLKTPLIAATPRRVRCPACAETLVARRDEAGLVHVHSLQTAPEGSPPQMPETEVVTAVMGAVSSVAPPPPPEGFDEETRGRKRTVMEGPSARDNISGLHDVESVTDHLDPAERDLVEFAPESGDLEDSEDFEDLEVLADFDQSQESPEITAQPLADSTPDPAVTAPEPQRRSTLSGPRIVLGQAVQQRVAVHSNRTTAMETVRDLDALTPITAAPAPRPAAQVRTSAPWSPAVDTEVTHEPSQVRALPRRRLAWGVLLIAALAVIVGASAGAWLILQRATSGVAATAEQAAAPVVGLAEAAQSAAAAAAAAGESDESGTSGTSGTSGEAARAPAAPDETTAPKPIPPAQAAPEPAAPEPVVPKPVVPKPASATQPPDRTPPPVAALAAPYEVFDTAADASAPWLALRSRPDRRSKLLAEMADDTGVRVLARRGTWWKLRIIGGEDDGLEGWAHKRWVRRAR